MAGDNIARRLIRSIVTTIQWTAIDQEYVVNGGVGVINLFRQNSGPDPSDRYPDHERGKEHEIVDRMRYRRCRGV